MSDEEIERLCAEATPGPWAYFGVDSISGGSFYGEGWMLGAVHWANDLPRHSGSDLLDSDFRTPEIADVNGEFIAASRSLVPDLLARAQRADEERDAAIREQARLHGLIDDLRVGLYWSDHQADALLARKPVKDRTECKAYAESMLDRSLLDGISEATFLSSLSENMKGEQ